MKVICVQPDIVWEDKEANFSKIRSLLQEESIPKDSLIILPEMFSTGFSMNVKEICEDESRPVENFLHEMAIQHNSYVLGGLVTQSSDRLGRNETVVVNSAGNEIARYCKLHPFSYTGENQHYCSGTDIVTFKWLHLTVAPFICYDLRFPEIFRHAVQKGAELFVVIANWPKAREQHWITLLTARAIENQAYVIGVNRCGNDPKLAYSGRSMVIDPHGSILIDGGNLEGAFSIELDPDLVQAWRKEFPVLNDIRMEYRH